MSTISVILALRDQEPILQSHVNLLSDTFRTRITQFESRTASINLTNEHTYTTFDVVSEQCLGKSFDCVKNSSFYPWASMLFSHPEDLSLFAVFRYFNSPSMVIQMILPKSVNQRPVDHFHDQRNGPSTTSPRGRSHLTS